MNELLQFIGGCILLFKWYCVLAVSLFASWALLHVAGWLFDKKERN